MKVVIGFIILLTHSAAIGQSAQPPARTGAASQPSPSPAAAPHLNPWELLPAVSPDRCLAEDLGTASDPNTGAPVRASVDPQTGKPLCHVVQPNSEPKSPR